MVLCTFPTDVTYLIISRVTLPKNQNMVRALQDIEDYSTTIQATTCIETSWKVNDRRIQLLDLNSQTMEYIILLFVDPT